MYTQTDLTWLYMYMQTAFTNIPTHIYRQAFIYTHLYTRIYIHAFIYTHLYLY